MVRESLALPPQLLSGGPHRCRREAAIAVVGHDTSAWYRGGTAASSDGRAQHRTSLPSLSSAARHSQGLAAVVAQSDAEPPPPPPPPPPGQGNKMMSHRCRIGESLPP